LLSHVNGYTNTPEYYVVRTFPGFFHIATVVLFLAMQSPSPQMACIGWALRTLLLNDSSQSVLRDHKSANCVYRRSASGRELVDWIMSLSPSIHTRHQAIGMWQALLEEGVISHGNLASGAQYPYQTIPPSTASWRNSH